MNRPFFMDNHLHAFIANGDFGTLYQRQVGTDGQEHCVPLGRLQDYIPTIVNHGVGSSASLLTLLTIYIAHHRLADPDDRAIWIPNEEMLDYLGAGVEYLEWQDWNLETRYNHRGEPIPKFDRRGLYFSSIQSLISLYRTRERTLTPAELVYINDPQLADDLATERTFLSGHMRCLREQRAAEAKAKRETTHVNGTAPPARTQRSIQDQSLQ